MPNRISPSRVTLLLLVVACGGGAVDPELDYALHHRIGADTVATPAAAAPTTGTGAATMTLTQRDTTLTVGTTLGITAVLVDSAGRVLYDRPIAWSSSDPAVATVAASGDVQARSAGSTTIAAAYGALRQVMHVRVTPVLPPPPATVAMVAFAPYDTVVQLGDSTWLQVRAADVSGKPIATTDRAVSWAVDASGTAPIALHVLNGPADSTARWVYATNVGIGRVAVGIDGVDAVATIRVAGPTPATTPQVARVDVTVWVSDLVVGETSVVTATAFDANATIVPTAPLRLQSVNPAAGQITQDSVGTGLRAGIVFGTLRATAPGIFSVIGETWDGRAFGQTTVTVRAAGVRMSRGSGLGTR